MNIDEIWQKRLWIWLPALLFFLANAGAFTVYRLGYAGNVQSLGRDIDNAKTELKRLQGDRLGLETLLSRVDANRRQVDGLYQRFATRRERLTDVTAEVQNLARKAGMSPGAFAYPEQEIEDYGLVKRSFIFSVDGTYLELRKFLDLLELSDSFLTLEDASLSEASKGQELRINLTLSTLFTKEHPKPNPTMPATPATPATPTTSGASS
jgi:Tfp pilus assembly protein PilO